LRERMTGVPFQGVAGNLGYYMTPALIGGASAWAHNTRYPHFPLPDTASYLGFHWQKDVDSGVVHSAFQGAHPAAVALDCNGYVRILPRIAVEYYTVRIAEREFMVDQVNDPHAITSPVVAFTPGAQTDEVKMFRRRAETSAGADRTWQTYAPMIPLADAADRVHVFLANEGDGRSPREKVVAVWEGSAPLPSFGAVLSFTRAYFEQLFSSVQAFRERYLTSAVHIVPAGDFDPYVQIMGGFVPVVADGEHLLTDASVQDVMAQANRYGNAHSPISQLGRETENFHPYIREPAGVLFQTPHTIGWALFDGRHELSIGASLVDVVVLLRKLEASDIFQSEPIQQAIIIDGGSAMKAYHVQGDHTAVRLDLLNRVAAGARNGPSRDPDGRNLYALLMLALQS
ncbi:MAG: hypothetical protein K8S97_00605, partial [Anaerolineae bacterium]|nr:hypothetical protein [Anaerolineae bacterium]